MVASPAMVVFASLLSACGWHWGDPVSLLPQYKFEVTLEVERNADFIKEIIENAKAQGFEEIHASQSPGFGSTLIYIESEEFLIIFTNAGERMEHRSDALCQIINCQIAEESDFSTFSATFCCEQNDCDLAQLRFIAQNFQSELDVDYIATSVAKPDYN